MEVVLVRHAQPDWYSGPGETHRNNPPLTELGHRQAESVGEMLAAEQWDRILVSPLLRCRQTAAPLLKRLGREEVIADWLEEIRDPDWSGFTRDDVFKQYEAESTTPINDRYRGLPGGENIHEFTDRIEHGLAGFLSEYGIVRHEHEVPSWTSIDGSPAEKINGPRVLLVAHGGTNAVVSASLLGAPRVPWQWSRIGYQHTTVGRFMAHHTSHVLHWMLFGLETHHLPADIRTR
jgi:2,3-bisphosphoglycerate-dependent phosphoglycerate mutase